MMFQPSEMGAFAQALRQQAEAVLRHQPRATNDASDADLQRLVYELQVHQVELELQNEELRRHQEALQIARDQYAMLYDFAPVGYLTLDAQGTIVAANLTAATMLGVTRKTLPGMLLSRFVVRDDQDRFYLHRRQVLEVDTQQTCDLRLQRPDGSDWVAALESRRAEARAGQGYQCLTTLNDITARQQSERLALKGQYASGLAHEIGPLLALISGNSERLCMELQAQHLPTQTVEAILHQTDRVIDLVQQFLGSGRSESPVMRPFSLRSPLDQALRLLETAFQGDGITVVLDLPEDLPLLWGIADQFELVFLNVMVNAWQAMPTGGTLSITARESADKRLQITFSDTGVGMERADLERAFEPFYTTKGSQGTGLGLSICQQIVETHQGHITLESIAGVGTTVHLDLVGAAGRS
jgi:PAS domain S-box-containing protein